jgi:CheY-like chemotaxis protein
MKVLLVDDDMRTVYAVSALLRAKGAEVFVADTGRAALQALDEHPDAEVVLMDMMMPEMDGYEAMRRIRTDQRFQALPIVALTAKVMKGDRDRCLEAGATDYLPKPLDPDRLLALLQTKLRSEMRDGA